jgi:hypothetical protein
MKIAQFASRNSSDPLNGVGFNKADSAKISEAAVVLSKLDDELLHVMRSALAERIVWLDTIGNWTDGEAEDRRRGEQESAIIAFQATFEAKIARAYMDRTAEKENQS